MEYLSIPTPKSISNNFSSIHDNSNINVSSSNDAPSHHNSISSSVNNTPLNKINTNHYINTKKFKIMTKLMFNIKSWIIYQ